MLGTLTMYLDRESYERAGLVGKPHGVKGKRGSKPRWSESFSQPSQYIDYSVLIQYDSRDM